MCPPFGDPISNKHIMSRMRRAFNCCCYRPRAPFAKKNEEEKKKLEMLREHRKAEAKQRREEKLAAAKKRKEASQNLQQPEGN